LLLGSLIISRDKFLAKTELPCPVKLIVISLVPWGSEKHLHGESALLHSLNQLRDFSLNLVEDIGRVGDW
jgi:hypothetical protein